MFNKEALWAVGRAKLHNTGPLLTIHQTSRLVWLGLRSFIYYRAKQATKYMNPRLNVTQIISRSLSTTEPNLFFYSLLSKTSQTSR